MWETQKRGDFAASLVAIPGAITGVYTFEPAVMDMHGHIGPAYAAMIKGFAERMQAKETGGPLLLGKERDLAIARHERMLLHNLGCDFQHALADFFRRRAVDST